MATKPVLACVVRDWDRGCGCAGSIDGAVGDVVLEIIDDSLVVLELLLLLLEIELLLLVLKLEGWALGVVESGWRCRTVVGGWGTSDSGGRVGTRAGQVVIAVVTRLSRVGCQRGRRVLGQRTRARRGRVLVLSILLKTLTAQDGRRSHGRADRHLGPMSTVRATGVSTTAGMDRSHFELGRA